MEVTEVTDWSDLCERLGETLGNEQDRAELFAQFSQGTLSGFQIGRATVAFRAEGSELVIVAMKGKGLAQVLPVITESAERQGFTSMRCHTKRPGLLRLGQAIDERWHLKEYVLGVQLNGR